jgi:hypothetical protein
MLLRSVMSVHLQHIALLSASQRADNTICEIDIYHEYKHCVVFLSAVCSAHNTSSIDCIGATCSIEYALHVMSVCVSDLRTPVTPYCTVMHT